MGDLSFVKRDGTFYRIDATPSALGEKIVYAADEIGVEFSLPDNSDDLWTLHKIGPAEDVKKHFDESRAKLAASGLSDLADNLVFVSSSAWEPADLDKMIDNTGSLPFVLLRYGLTEKDQNGKWRLTGAGAGGNPS